MWIRRDGSGACVRGLDARHDRIFITRLQKILYLNHMNMLPILLPNYKDYDVLVVELIYIVEGLACLTRLNHPIGLSVRELPLWKFGMRATLDVDPSWLLFCDETFPCSSTLRPHSFSFPSTLVHRQNAGSGGGDEYVAPPPQLLLLANSPIDTNAGDRQVGRRAQLSNITAAKTYDPPSLTTTFCPHAN